MASLPIYKQGVTSTLRHFRRCFLKANRASKSEETKKDRHIIFESVLDADPN